MEEKDDNFKLEFVLDIDSIPKNSLLVFRVQELDESVYLTIEHLQKLYGEKMKEKNISFLILKPDSKLELIKPEVLESVGWVRKQEKSLIIH